LPDASVNCRKVPANCPGGSASWRKGCANLLNHSAN
jgi:hypothetical protein